MEKVEIRENKIYVGENSVSNFSIAQIATGVFELNNGNNQAYIGLEKLTLCHFRDMCYQEGFYVFTGNTKQLKHIFESLKFEI